ncbi:MAG: acetate--CoA ligase [Halobacterium sp.]
MPEGDAGDIETRFEGAASHAPPRSFVADANVNDPDVAARFDAAWPDAWDAAGDLLDWRTDYDGVLPAAEPPFEWFAGGTLNASENCLDRHLSERADQPALVWRGRVGDERELTYRELHREVNEVAAGLRDLGVEADDVVTLYMPTVPELVAAMLACARLGAVHNVVFAGLSADGLATRVASADSEYLVTCDGYYRRGTPVQLKSKADNAVASLESDLEATVVVERLDLGVRLGDDQYDYDALRDAHEGADVDPVERDASDELFRIHTSGTTGDPTEVTHLTGGYLAHVAWTSHAVLDLSPADTHLCTANAGWITGHSYVVYGPLALGATTVLFEGAPDHPEKDRIWRIVEEQGVDVFYTAPTAIRAFMKWGEGHLERHDLSSLRLLGTVGEPVTPDTWRWYYEHVGNGECPVVDTWWQTETGAMMLATLPAVDEMKPGAAGPALPGIDATVVDAGGDPVDPGEAGYLVLTRPWPAMPRELREGTGWASASRSLTDDWGYVTGDSAKMDEDGYVTVLGRVDDVVNVGGHRFGTMELESAIVDLEGVTEAGVVSVSSADCGVVAYVTLAEGVTASGDLRERIREHVRSVVASSADPERIVFTSELPKTRSGKIVRRFLERVAAGEDVGDTSALRNPEVVGELDSILDDD